MPSDRSYGLPFFLDLDLAVDGVGGEAYVRTSPPLDQEREILEVDLESGAWERWRGDFDNPRKVEFDPFERKLYWSKEDEGVILRANPVGTGAERVLESERVAAFAVDGIRRKLYGAADSNRNVVHAEFFATPALLFEEPNSVGDEIAVDVMSGQVFWWGRFGLDRLDVEAGGDPDTVYRYDERAYRGIYQELAIYGNAAPTTNNAVATLDIIPEGEGSGRVTSSPDGIDCDAECSAESATGSVVTLTFIPDPGSYFAGLLREDRSERTRSPETRTEELYGDRVMRPVFRKFPPAVYFTEPTFRTRVDGTLESTGMQLRRYNLTDGSVDTIDVLLGDDAFDDIEVDAPSGKLYVARRYRRETPGRIELLTEIVRSDLDGRSREVVVERRGWIKGLAVDSLGGKLYWTAVSDVGLGYAIHELDLSGSSGSTPRIWRAPVDPRTLEIDPFGRRLYYHDLGRSDPALRRANLNGSLNEVVVPVEGGTDRPLAVDGLRQQLYHLDPLSGEVLRSPILRSVQGPETFYREVNSWVDAIAVDHFSGDVYWTSDHGIKRVDGDGLAVQTIYQPDIPSTITCLAVYQPGSPADDGDGDGVPDLLERRDGGIDFDARSNVVSFPNGVDGSSVWLESERGTQLVGVDVVPPPDDPPPTAEFPLGFFSFRIEGLVPGAETTVVLYPPPGVDLDTFWKYGPTPDNPHPHWYEFPFAGTTNDGGRILLYVDGGLGDADLGANGVIVDPGGSAVSVPDSDGDGIVDARDNCPSHVNPDQRDGNGVGDACEGTRFRRGDANGDQGVNIADGVFVLLYLFRHRQEPSCPDAADANDDGALNLSDAVYALRFLFRDGDPIPAPGIRACGEGPTADTLGAYEYSEAACEQ